LQDFAEFQDVATGEFQLLPQGSPPDRSVEGVWMVFPGERIIVPRSRARSAWSNMSVITETPGANAYRRLRRFGRRLLMTLPFAARAMTPAWAVCPGLEQIVQGVMLGNGTRAKLFDFDRGFIYNVPVSSSALTFFESEMTARSMSAGIVPGPDLVEYEVGDLPYTRERLISGRPWRGNPATDSAPVTLLSGLAEMYRAIGTRQEPAEDYLASLSIRLDELSQTCDRDIPRARQLIQELKSRLDRSEIGSSPITVVTAHGDFTSKNFLQEKSTNRTLLVDWEYAGTATLLHDAIHFTVVPMLERGDSALLEDLIDGNGPGSRLLGALKPLDQGFEDADGRRIMVGLYFLEREIRFLERFAVHSTDNSNIALRFDRAVTTIELAISATDGGTNPALVKERLVGATIR